jgi:hypothetical protein
MQRIDLRISWVMLMLSLMVSGCSTPQLEGVKELSNHPEFPKAREAAPEFTRAALKKVARLEYEIERR